MFLFRTAFCLSLVVLLLPTDAHQQAKLYNAASGAVTHAMTFCDRNASLCTQGAQHWVTFKHKLEFAGRMAVDIASEQLRGERTARQSAAAPTPHPASGAGAGTLSPADLAPAWRGGRGERA